ncbi:phosphoglycerate dehydrogenase-like enzyme [Lentzea atacamensis]|uniref:Phosphoglycerate dehydrogenase-like enzyme n=1 Tax=Lentzea atacamensis TaxID=531938 RepID=A0A316HY29_9PSEU|nr:hydroxyacid dehydrogenase [Lentzea atacamensis]PWK85081.1 phosphoglycerate dehydrogenase-like enzyme [Lentzea atacamensis]
MRGAGAMSAEAAATVLAPVLGDLKAICDFGPVTRNLGELPDVDLLVTGWGCPPITAEVLERLPGLKAIVHTAGSVKGFVTDACWERGIAVSSAASANALPVAEYTVAMILLTGKRVLERARDYRATKQIGHYDLPPTVGNYGATIGILSASMIGRRVIELLRPYDFHVLVHDPFVTEVDGAESVGITELFGRSDVVSVHTPLLPETRGLVNRELLGLLRDDAVLINTARGAVVDQEALAAEAGRIRAVLDVTDPEVLPAGHPLWHNDNVLITPHLAGSQGNEWLRLAHHAVAEVRRWVAGEPFLTPVPAERRERIA